MADGRAAGVMAIYRQLLSEKREFFGFFPFFRIEKALSFHQNKSNSIEQKREKQKSSLTQSHVDDKHFSFFFILEKEQMN